MNLDLAAMKESCNNLSKNRAALFGYEQVLGASVVVKMAGSAAKNIAHGIGGLLSKDSSSATELWEIKKIPRETKFLQACQTVLANLEQIKANYFRLEFLDSLKSQLAKKEVLISFYGDTSVGKSTLLNSIMEDHYLPVQHGAETAVTVKICYNHQNSPPGQPVDKLCYSGKVVAEGVKNIRETLQEYNTKSRNNNCDVGTIELHVSRNFGYESHQVPQIVHLDNPGCDENGSQIILSHVDKAKRSSTAFIFVTTFQQFKTMACSKALQNIFLQNPGIIRNKRLAVVINKMDQIFLRRPGEAKYSTMQVIDEVHRFLCGKVFGCEEEQIAKDYIFLVCGTWAYYGKMYKKNQDDFEEAVEMEIDKIKYMKEFDPVIKGKIDRETPTETKAPYLIELSNITKLEKRLHSMTASSFYLWKCKMNTDVLSIMQETVQSMTQDKQRQTESAKETEVRIQPFHEVICSISKLYKRVLKEQMKCKRRLPRNLHTANLFRDACIKDYDKTENFSKILHKTTDEAIELFKSDTTKKIRRGSYSAENLMKDLEPLMKDISMKISVHLSSWNVMSNLVKAYSTQSVQMWKETVNLREQLAVILGSNHRMDRESQISYPNLTGPDLQVSLELPLNLPFMKKLWIFLQKFFRRKKIEFPTKLNIIFNEGNDSNDELQSRNSTRSSTSLEESPSKANKKTNSTSSRTSLREDCIQESNEEQSDSYSSQDDHDDDYDSDNDLVTISKNNPQEENSDTCHLFDATRRCTSGSVSSSSSSQLCGLDNPSHISSPINAFDSKSNIQLEDIENPFNQSANDDINPENDFNESAALSRQNILKESANGKVYSSDGMNSYYERTSDLQSGPSATSFVEEPNSETSFSQSKYSKASDSGLNMCIDDINYKERPIVHEKVSKVTRYSEETSDSRRTNSCSNIPSKEASPTATDDESSTNKGDSVLEDTTVEKCFENVRDDVGTSNSDIADTSRILSVHITSSSMHNREDDSDTADKGSANKELESTRYVIGLNILEELTKQLRELVKENITSYVQNMNTNIVLVYCQTYYEAAVSTLKEFDKSAVEDLRTAEKFLKVNIESLEFQRESIKNLDRKLGAIRAMVEQFASINVYC